MYGTCLWIYTPEVGWEEKTDTKIARKKLGNSFFRAAFCFTKTPGCAGEFKKSFSVP